MIHRIFDYAEVPAHCAFDGPDAQPVMALVVKLSGQKAILDVSQGDFEFEVNTTLAVKLELDANGKPSRELEATIQHCDDGYLFLRWNHADEDMQWKLQDFLAAHARDLDEIEEARARAAKEKAKAEKAKRLKQAKKKKATEKKTTKKVPSVKRQGPLQLREVEGPDDLGDPSDDGVGASILRKSRRVSAADLAEQVDSVRVLNMTTITRLIQNTVDETVMKLDREWDEDQRKSLLEEAECAFNERMATLKAENTGLQAQAKNLNGELERAQNLLVEEQNKVISANQFTVSDAGMQEMERRLERLLEHSVRTGNVSEDTEAEMRRVVSKLLDDEREKIRQQAEDAQSDAIELLERKVNRLARTLDETQKAKDRAERRAQALESAGVGPMRNLYAAGLDEEDPDKEKKLALLREIIETNREVRSHMAEKGVELKARKKPQELAGAATSEAAGEAADGDADGGDFLFADGDVPIILTDDTDLHEGAVAGPAWSTTEMEEMDLNDAAPWKPGTTLQDILEQDDGDSGDEDSGADSSPTAEAGPSDGGVKKIEVPRAKPPPLERTR